MSAIAIMPCPRYRSAARVAADLRAQFVAEAADRASNFAGHAARAARRGDMRAASVRIEQVRLCAIAAAETISERGGE